MKTCEAALYWDSEANALAKARANVFYGEERAHWEKALFSLLPSDKPLRILDAGSGSGFLSVILAGLGHTIVGIDISPVMVQCAYETASAMGQRIEYRIMDCTKTDFDNESFDVIVCCEVMSYLSDVKTAWLEFRRILKKEGHVIIFDTGRMIAEQAQAWGFSHCRIMDFEGLKSTRQDENLRCMSARKPSQNERHNIPQIALFKRHVQTVKKQIQLYQNWCQSVGMPDPEYTVLNMISHHPKGSRPSDISTALVIPPQTLTRILAGLEREGYIDRQTNESDRRSAIITITETGADKIRPLQNTLHEIEEKALISFDVDELTKFSELSDKLLNEFDSTFSRHISDGSSPSLSK